MRSVGKLSKKSKRGCKKVSLNSRTSFPLQSNDGIDAKRHHQQGLYAMHNQGEYAGIGNVHPVEHHHGDNSEVPRPGAIGSRDNDSKRAADKHYQRSQYAQVLGEPEAIKSYIKMKEVTEPDEKRI